MANSPVLNIRLLASDAIDREAVMNEAIIAFEVMANKQAGSFTRTSPTTPAPVDGDCFIVPASGAAGAWTTHPKEIAYYLNGWHYITPRTGWIFYIVDASAYRKYDGTNWVVVGAPSVSNLDELTDVVLSSPTLNQVLKYNGTNWVNSATPAPAGPLDGLSDVTLSSPSSGQLLQFNGTEWINVTVGYNLNALTDVVIGTPALNDVLRYNGTNWVNMPVTAVMNEIKDIGDVDDTGRAVNDVLMWNGAAWIASSVGIQVSFMNMLEGPSTGFNANPNRVPIVDPTGTVFDWTDYTFTALLDTPSSYSGQAGRAVRVNAGGTALEFFDISVSAAFKDPCKAATTANIALTGAQTIDGIACVTNDRVLVKDQTTGSQNGIYVVNSGGAWSRALDMDSSAETIPSMTVPVQQGTFNGDKLWMLTTNGPITLGTTALAFASIGGGASAFTALVDAPSSYTGQAKKHVRVNAGATALEFVDNVLTTYDDFPASYTGQSGKGLRVNVGATGLEFYTLPVAYTNEDAMDAIAGMIAAGAHSGVSIIYNDAGDSISFSTVGQQPMLVPFFFDNTPTASELLMDFVFPLAATFSANWAGSVGAVTVAPSATFNMDVRKNGVSVGTLSVSTGGVVTFTGTANFSSGDRMQVVAPGVPDVAIARGSFTFKGLR